MLLIKLAKVGTGHAKQAQDQTKRTHGTPCWPHWMKAGGGGDEDRNKAEKMRILIMFF